MTSHIDELDRRRGGEDSEIGTSHSFSAPTPYNTYFSPSVNDPVDDYDHLSTPAKSSGSVSFEAYPGGGGDRDGDVSFGPSISSPSRDHDHDHDRSTTYSASHASAHLISPTRSFDPTMSVLPPSNLSIPDPPSRLSSAGIKSSLMPLSDVGSSSFSESSSKPRWTWKGRKKAKLEMTQDDRDAQRLKQLGYDAVLGREYNFWSSLAITTLNIGALQASHAVSLPVLTLADYQGDCISSEEYVRVRRATNDCMSAAS